MSEETDKPQVLIVDDSKVIRKAASKMLGADYAVHEAVDGMDGWQQLQQNESISVVFTDLQMPELNGMELLAKIREADDERLANMPVIMITGQGDTEEAKKKVFEAGATDFISKPFETIDLLSRAKSYARLNRKVVELEKRSGHDKLTGLFSASSFEEQGTKALSFARRHKLSMSTVFFEIEDFQELYLAHGKSIAQQILVAVGKRFQESMRTEDVAARVGVARFAVLLPLTSDVKSRIIISRIRETINKLVFNTGKDKIRVALAAGYTSPDMEEETDFQRILEQTELALQRALSKDGEKIVGYYEQEETVEVEPDITDADLQDAFGKVLAGDYYQIPDYILQAVANRMAPFIEYVANQKDAGMTGTDS